MLVHLLPLLLSVDPSLGRVDKSALSQQTLMEILLDGLVHKEKILGFGVDTVSDISHWPGLTIENGEVISIVWNSHHLGGSIALEYLPPTLTTGYFLGNEFEGTASLVALPDRLCQMVLYLNRMSGSLNLTTLPPAMESFNVHTNGFTGSLDLTYLPATMRDLNVSCNKLSGALDFTQLPATLNALYVHSNPFSGLADFRCLPSEMQVLCMDNTQLEGSIHMKKNRVVSGKRSMVTLLTE